jgi:hypothetical protein
MSTRRLFDSNGRPRRLFDSRGNIIPRCPCGGPVYAEHFCYNCYQTAMKPVSGALNSYENRIYRLRKKAATQ